MLRLPAVAGRFYPSNAEELTVQVRRYAEVDSKEKARVVKACLVPHAGYMYSGHVAGAVFARMALSKKFIVLGVRHQPRGEAAAVLSNGAWRTPLGDAAIDEELAKELKEACPQLREDAVAHSAEHSLEVQIPFLQVLAEKFTFVPVALGTVRFEELTKIGEGIGKVLSKAKENVLLLTTSDLNHYEDDATTRAKDAKAVEQLLAMNASGLYETCRKEQISMCGLGPAVAMLTALKEMGGAKAEVVKYATSADVSNDRETVVGYVGMIFE